MLQEIEIVWLQQKDGDWTNHKKTHSETLKKYGFNQIKECGSLKATSLPADHPL